MKKPEVDIRIFYLCVHKKLNERVDRYRIMNKKDFYDILGRLYHLPKKLWPCVMKEMEDMDMIEDLGSRRNNNIKVNPMFKDPVEDANEFYEKLGIF
mgnify:FL=1|tara:strand:+ start:107 stop:397 length:291 start_codon:yes stop_codon:yes gene_type:complete